jgi:hypothetical protein
MAFISLCCLQYSPSCLIVKHLQSVRFEVLMAVYMSLLVLWLVTVFGRVGVYQRSGRTYCLHLQACAAKYAGNRRVLDIA